MTEIFRPPYFQPDSVNGVPLAGALLFFYTAGTTNLITVYQDSGLITPHASPVVADASGIFPAIYVNTSSYKIVLQTSAGVTVKTYDNINTTSSSSTVLDSIFTIQNASDNTKQVQFSAANLTTGTTRTFAFPDTNGTLLTTGSAATLAQALAGTSSSVVLAPNALGQERSLSNAPFWNLSISTGVAANALTVAVKGADGNDPSAANPVTIGFRSATLGSGLTASLTLTAALSLVVSSGSTLGSTSAVAATYPVAVFNDAGTARLAIINPLVLPLTDGIASTTAEGGAGAADSAGVWYTGTAATSKAYTIIGFITATEATAGTWATAPSTVQVGPAYAANNALPLITPYAAYTPVFTGFGTVTSISAFSRKAGDSLEGYMFFTSGTHTAVEPRIAIGFNGTSGNVSSDATKIAAITTAQGNLLVSNVAANSYYPLIESAKAYIVIGVQGGSTAGLTKFTDATNLAGSQKYAVSFRIPIQGW